MFGCNVGRIVDNAGGNCDRWDKIIDDSILIKENVVVWVELWMIFWFNEFNWSVVDNNDENGFDVVNGDVVAVNKSL